MGYEGGNLKPGMWVYYVTVCFCFRDDGLNAFGKAMTNNVWFVASDKRRYRTARIFKEVHCYLHRGIVPLNCLCGINYQPTMRLTLRHL